MDAWPSEPTASAASIAAPAAPRHPLQQQTFDVYAAMTPQPQRQQQSFTPAQSPPSHGLHPIAEHGPQQPKMQYPDVSTPAHKMQQHPHRHRCSRCLPVPRPMRSLISFRWTRPSCNITCNTRSISNNSSMLPVVLIRPTSNSKCSSSISSRTIKVNPCR